MVSTLDRVGGGTRAQILSINDEAECVQCLRRLGLREGMMVEVVSNHDPVMLRFDGCCLALRRCMLKGVTICRCGH